ncbi:MAG: ATP-binding protein [Alphaproteobacteria bacterium]
MTARPVATAAPALDLSQCDREPIHTPATIQAHGALFVLDPGGGTVVQAAIGDVAGRAIGLARAEDALGRRFLDLLPPAAAAVMEDVAGRLPPAGAVHLGRCAIGGRAFHLIAHRADGAILVELDAAAVEGLETFDAVYPQFRNFLDEVRRTPAVDALLRLVAREVRRLTGFDRALVYRFDAQWNGEVVAEDRNDRLPSYLGHHFPASDIPAPARALYRVNRLRLIPDADYRPAPIVPPVHPATGRPTDLSHAGLRGVSPIHLEYMRNMGTMASMSISLMPDDALWGLISCHHHAPAAVPLHVRTACDFVGQVLSMQLAAREASALANQQIALREVETRLLTHMAAADHFVEGLVSHPTDLLALTDAAGAAVVVDGRCVTIGDAPAEDDVRRIVRWLAEQRRGELFATDGLAAAMPGAERMKDTASGVLALSISQLHTSYVIWFRPEIVRTIVWGGDPRKPAGDGRLTPRRSFESWRETVRLRARPWRQAEIDVAAGLRAAIVDIVLRKAEEMAALSERLTSINRELEAFSYSVSHDLRAPFRHIVGYAQLLKRQEGERLTERGNRYLETIVESAISAGTLVDDLLSFSQMGRASLRPTTIDMGTLVADLIRRLTIECGERVIDWRIGELPPVVADPMMIRLVLQNLLENAIKFTRDRAPAVIAVEGTASDDEVVFQVRDNGVGFDMAYVGKLFGVFQRLHRVEDFEGTGIGLANVKRIIDRHGGRVWATGKLNAGAAIFFALPTTKEG